MKLILENWNQYLIEEELREEILKYLDENNIVLTEAELEEAMPRWLRRLGAGAALAGTVAGAAGPAQAQSFSDMFADRMDQQAAEQQAQVNVPLSQESGEKAANWALQNIPDASGGQAEVAFGTSLGSGAAHGPDSLSDAAFEKSFNKVFMQSIRYSV